MNTKVCSVCNVEKHFNRFSSSFKTKDFLLEHCKSCEVRVKHRKEFKKELRRKEKIRVRKSKRAEYRSLSKTERKLREPKWLTPEHRQQIQQIYREARLKTEIGPKQYHVDHIVPLLGENVSGLHVPWNLQVLEATENSKKGNKF